MAKTTRLTWLSVLTLGGFCVACQGSAAPASSPAAAPARAEAPTLFTEAEAARVRQKLDGKWSLFIPNMRPQELLVQGDKAKRTILPEEGQAGQKPDILEGKLTVVSPTQFQIKGQSEEDTFYFWWDKEGALHLHSLSFFKPVPITDRKRFVIEDEGTGQKLSFEGGKCLFTNYEVTTPKEVTCGFVKEGTLPGVSMLGGVTEIFYYAIPGKEKEEDPYFRNEIFYVDGNLLVPSTLAMSSATKEP